MRRSLGTVGTPVQLAAGGWTCGSQGEERRRPSPNRHGMVRKFRPCKTIGRMCTTPPCATSMLPRQSLAKRASPPSAATPAPTQELNALGPEWRQPASCHRAGCARTRRRLSGGCATSTRPGPACTGTRVCQQNRTIRDRCRGCCAGLTGFTDRRENQCDRSGGDMSLTKASWRQAGENRPPGTQVSAATASHLELLNAEEHSSLWGAAQAFSSRLRGTARNLN